MTNGNSGSRGPGAKALALAALLMAMACGRAASSARGQAAVSGAIAPRPGGAAEASEVVAVASASWARNGFRDDEGIERLPADSNPNYR
jgi:hypothetical protein